MDRFNEIKKIYADVLPSIFKNYPHTDPYFYDWNSFFSPIEKLVWIEIRSIGLPMFPQFPTNGFFIDFADPVKKIGIEADGKEFHQDAKKDLARQRVLEECGWKIYRIRGAHTFLNQHDSSVDGSPPVNHLDAFLRGIIEDNYEDLDF